MIERFHDRVNDVSLFNTDNDWSHLPSPIEYVAVSSDFQLDCLANAAVLRIAARARRTGADIVKGATDYREKQRLARLFDIPMPEFPLFHEVEINGSRRLVDYPEHLDESAGFYDDLAASAASKFQSAGHLSGTETSIE